MNVEVDNETLVEIEHAFKFNDAVLRHLTVLASGPVTTPSPMMREEKSRSLTTEEGGRPGQSGGDAPRSAPAEDRAQAEERAPA
jgi:small subunit ribosomal protein S6